MFNNPRFIARSELIDKDNSHLSDSGFEIAASTKTNFQYKLDKEFGDLLKCVNVDNKVYIAPFNYTFEALASDYIKTKNKGAFERGLSASEQNEVAADTLRNSIKNTISSVVQIWPPNIKKLSIDDFQGPEILLDFLAKLLSSSRNKVVILSIAQDILYAASWKHQNT